MDESKLDKIEEIFLKSTKPKIVIEKGKKISKLGGLFDATKQGENALTLATTLAKALNLPIKVFTADDFYMKISKTSEDIRRKEKEMSDYVAKHYVEAEVAYEIEPLISPKIDKILTYMDEDEVEEEKLSRLLLNTLIKEKMDIVVSGSPLLVSREENGNFGFYLRKLLKESEIEANFLLVPSEMQEFNNLLLGLVNYRQKEDSKEIILKQGLELKPWINNIRICGIIEENTIDTIAKAELPEGEEETAIDFAEVRNMISDKYKDKLSNYTFEDEDMDLSCEVKIGVITSSVKSLLEKHQPGLVLVRNVSKSDENLDPEAETLARIALTEGYPVLLVWDK